MGLKEKGAILALIKFLSGTPGGTDVNTPNNNVENIPQPKSENVEIYNKEISEGTIEYNSKTNEVENKDNDRNIIVDISQFQGDVDWEKLKEMNPSLVIVRSHYASGDTFYEDDKFEENMKKCAEYNFNVGTYFIARLTQDEDEIKREANIMLERLQEIERNYGVRSKLVAIDYEMTLHTSNPEISAKSIRMLCDMLSSQEYTPMIYASTCNYNDLLYAAEKVNIDLTDILEWIAYYASANSYAVTNSTQSMESAIENAYEIIDSALEKYALLQIGDNIKYTNGINDKIDVSVVTSDKMEEVINTEYISVGNTENTENEIISNENNKQEVTTIEKNEQNVNIEKPTEEIKELKQNEEKINEEKENIKLIPNIVSEGETVSEICEKFNMTIDEFKLYNPNIEDINKIEAKQTVNIPLENIEANINEQAKTGEITNKEADSMTKAIKKSMILFGSSAFGACVIDCIVKSKKRKKEQTKSQYKYNENWEEEWNKEYSNYSESSNSRKQR